MPEDRAPDDVRRLADRRRAARTERDWAEADRLKAEIEAAGWRVVDRGRAFSLERAHPPDMTEGGVTRYGASASVPSVLDRPPTADVTVVRAVPDDASTIGAAPGGEERRLQVVLAANRPDVDLTPGQPEVVLLNGWPGSAAAFNAGIRRAAGRVVVLAEPDVDLSASDLDALARTFEDPLVAVAGPVALASDDLRRFRARRVSPDAGGTDAADAIAIGWPVIAFRRADYVGRGPLDEGFASPYRLDVWWSLTLRDGGPDRPPRRALAVDLPSVPQDTVDAAAADPDDNLPATPADPARRRNFYRLVRAYGGARHLFGAR